MKYHINGFVETLTLKQLKEKRNYCKAMSIVCRKRRQEKLALFYDNAVIGYDLRIDNFKGGVN